MTDGSTAIIAFKVFSFLSYEDIKVHPVVSVAVVFFVFSLLVES